MRALICTTALALMSSMAIAGETPANPDAKVYFVNLEDGATVSGPVKVIFGLSGMGVAPSGTEADMTGHHHLLLNRAALGDGAEDQDMIDYGIPADENHLHYGKGQTETVLELSPGTHTLQLLLGDLNHVPHDPVVASEQITITVN